MLFLAHRKLFAKGFLSALAPWRFLPTGNCSPGDFSTPLCSARNDKRAWLHGVSCPPETVREGFPIWPCLHGVSYPQETVREGFPIRLGSMVLLTHRKLFAKGFLSALAPWRFLPTGNCSPGDFSTPLCSARNDKRAWLHGVSCPPETIRVWSPVRLGSMIFLTHRKLFAYSFLSALTPWRFLPTGNCSRRVSYSAWLHGVACPQETVRREISRLRFAPLEMTKGRGSMAFLAHRKLFAKGFLSALAPCCFLPRGNCLRRRFLDSALLRSK